jgi:arylsulfatase A-like enzyme
LANFNGVFDRQLLDKIGYTQQLVRAGYAVHHIGKWHLPARNNPGHWGFRTFVDDDEHVRVKLDQGLLTGCWKYGGWNGEATRPSVGVRHWRRRT